MERPPPERPDPHAHTESTGTFAVEPVLCAYGEGGIQGASDWIVIIVDVETAEHVRDVEVASLELLDHATGEVVSATLPIDVRVMSPNQPLDDLSRRDNEQFSGQLEPLTRLRLRVQANLVERQIPLRDGLPGRSSFCTPDGDCYGHEGSGCCHVADWEACSMWPSAAP
jgi:hypothetical protein